MPTLADAFERVGVTPVRRRLHVEARVPSLREGAIVVGGWIGSFVVAMTFAAGLQYLLERLLDESEPAANQAPRSGSSSPSSSSCCFRCRSC